MLTKKFDLPTHVAFKKELSIAEIKKQLPLQLEETRFLKDISFDPKNNRVTQTIAIIRECPACFLIFLSVVSSSHETDRLSRCA